MIRNHNFYNLNAGRSYPLDDRATRTGDRDERLPNGVITDLNLRFPGHLGEYAYLSSLAVTNTLITATFLACPSPTAAPDTFVPLAAVTARKPINESRHVVLNPLYPGVGGWIVFGAASENFNARFSTPQQGLLLPRCARPYFKLPVESVQKLGLATALTGIVTIKGGADVEVTAGDRIVDGRLREVIVVRLNSFSSGRNVFDLYKGPCGGRPESENCNKPGVEFLNTVGPDCNGNIEIVFLGDTVATPYDGSSEGVILDHPIGLTEACTKRDRLPDQTGRLPNEYDDFCTSEFEGQNPVEDTNTAGEDPLIYNVPSVSSEVQGCPSLPFEETFDDADAEDFRVLHGQFGFAVPDSPAQTVSPTLVIPYTKDYTVFHYGSSSSSAGRSSSSAFSSIVPDSWSYEAQAVNRRNVSIWDSCAHDSTTNKRFRSDVMIVTGGPKLNAGIVLNYHTVGTLSQHDEYMIAEIDQPSDSLRLRLWTGTTFLTLGVISGVGIKVGDWYKIEAEITPGGDPLTQTLVKVTLTGVTDPLITASFTAATTRYLPDNGRFGLGSDQSVARFSYFFLENI